MDGDEPFQSDCDSHEDGSCDRNLLKEGKTRLFRPWANSKLIIAKKLAPFPPFPFGRSRRKFFVIKQKSFEKKGLIIACIRNCRYLNVTQRWNGYAFKPRRRSYQTFIFPVFRFLLLSFRVCSIRKKCVHCTTAKLSSKKRKNSLFPKKKSLVGLAPEHWINELLCKECLMRWRHT